MKALTSDLRSHALPAALPASAKPKHGLASAGLLLDTEQSRCSNSDEEDSEREGSEAEGSDPDVSRQEAEDDEDLQIDSGEDDGLAEGGRERANGNEGSSSVDEDSAGFSGSPADIEEPSQDSEADRGHTDSGESEESEEDSGGNPKKLGKEVRHDHNVHLSAGNPGNVAEQKEEGRGDATGAVMQGDVVRGGNQVSSNLFQGLVVWLAREVPREVLMLIIRSFGGSVCWDGMGSPLRESDERITHAIVDRPAQGHIRIGRVYVQPQWVFDSANFRVLVPTARYVPGRKLPPHLSPFVDYSEDGYVPEYAVELKKLQEASLAVHQREAGRQLEGGVAAFEAVQEGSTAPSLADDREVEQEQRFQEELALELGTLAPSDALHSVC
jgi:hypothetical protein